MTQHSTLTPERWGRFTLDQQILMIGNEMNRASRLFDPADRPLLQAAYERALRLTDLTVELHARRSLRRELLRWRDLVAALYIAARPDPSEHRAAFRALLLLHSGAARQIPLLEATRDAPPGVTP